MEEFSRRGGHLDAACRAGKSLGNPSGNYVKIAIEHGH